MQKPLTQELNEIFDALIIENEDSFTFAGRQYSANDPRFAPRSASASQHQASPIADVLTLAFYEHGYCRRFAGTLPDSPATATGEDLTAALSQANSSRDRWESGWTVAQTLASGQVAARRHGKARLFWPGEFMAAGAPGPLNSGAQITVFWKRESTGLQPGFYFAFGEQSSDHQDERNWIRFYWNVRPGGAAALVRAVTAELNRFETPFRFKLLSNSRLYGRSDAAVLYVARRYYRVASQLLERVPKLLGSELQKDTPLFTKLLAPGLSLAEDPNTGESFGMHRCRLMAEAVMAAHSAGQSTSARRLEALTRRFHEEGLSLEAPYLNARSKDDYPWHE